MCSGKEVNAQKITATTDRNKILIGEQVELVVKAEELNARTSTLQSWFSITDSTGHIQVLKRDAIDTVELNGFTTYIQKITLTSFDSGRWVLPPVTLSLEDKASHNTIVISSDSIVLNVIPVDVTGLNNYHDIKDIETVEVQPNYTLYAAIVLSVAGLIVLTWLIFRQKKKTPQLSQPRYAETALAAALKKLRELEAGQLAEKGKAKLYYTGLTNICRDYFLEQLQIYSAQLTSDEIMLKLSVYFRQQRKQTEFYQLLRLADAVKFAKYQPSLDENKNAANIAAESLKYIDSTAQEVKSALHFQQLQQGKKDNQVSRDDF
ncbi:MAG TPA: hypothetical protein PKM63_00805 [Panacibacter sp.]|nr:hypothetical protein [Panacibacter sp.]HNP42791.1 hypothetical protein [Panacibacter sp.]